MQAIAKGSPCAIQKAGCAQSSHPNGTNIINIALWQQMRRFDSIHLFCFEGFPVIHSTHLA